MDKDVIHMNNRISLKNMKKIENLALATTLMDIEGIMLTEITQNEKDKYPKTKQNKTNEQTKQIHSNRTN